MYIYIHPKRISETPCCLRYLLPRNYYWESYLEVRVDVLDGLNFCGYFMNSAYGEELKRMHTSQCSHHRVPWIWLWANALKYVSRHAQSTRAHDSPCKMFSMYLVFSALLDESTSCNVVELGDEPSPDRGNTWIIAQIRSNTRICLWDKV